MGIQAAWVLVLKFVPSLDKSTLSKNSNRQPWKYRANQSILHENVPTQSDGRTKEPFRPTIYTDNSSLSALSSSIDLGIQELGKTTHKIINNVDHERKSTKKSTLAE
eukprot:m.236766 g.236766  ORF g.236766 m.236766 type:complete len:107 (+) comp15786_c0_seq7:195-515(+)